MSVIHQEIVIAASPDRVYAVLTNGELFAKMSGGAPADIAAVDGGPFSLFGGHITGRNIELVPGSRVVQAWRAKTWPAGVYSIARFELVADGAGTKIIFDHTGFPPDNKAHLTDGWQSNYWGPLAKFFS